MNYIAVKLSYKASGLYGINIDELQLLNRELRENYISHIAPNPGPQAGGLVDAFVEVMVDTSFIDFFKVLRDGFIFDTVTRGKKSFLLKPLFDAFKRMETTNKYWDYTSVSFLFNDTQIIVYGINDMFTSRLNIVFDAISKHYKNLGEPYKVIIPITKDINSAGEVTYASYEGDDFVLEDYVGFWGVSCNAGSETMIYDVGQSKLFDGSWDY